MQRDELWGFPSHSSLPMEIPSSVATKALPDRATLGAPTFPSRQKVIHTRNAHTPVNHLLLHAFSFFLLFVSFITLHSTSSSAIRQPIRVFLGFNLAERDRTFKQRDVSRCMEKFDRGERMLVKYQSRQKRNDCNSIDLGK